MSYASIRDLVVAAMIFACILGTALGLFMPRPLGRGLRPFRKRP